MTRVRDDNMTIENQTPHAMDPTRALNSRFNHRFIEDKDDNERARPCPEARPHRANTSTRVSPPTGGGSTKITAIDRSPH